MNFVSVFTNAPSAPATHPPIKGERINWFNNIAKQLTDTELSNTTSVDVSGGSGCVAFGPTIRPPVMHTNVKKLTFQSVYVQVVKCIDAEWTFPELPNVIASIMGYVKSNKDDTTCLKMKNWLNMIFGQLNTGLIHDKTNYTSTKRIASVVFDIVNHILHNIPGAIYADTDTVYFTSDIPDNVISLAVNKYITDNHTWLRAPYDIQPVVGAVSFIGRKKLIFPSSDNTVSK